jgi:hypothetical protein
MDARLPQKVLKQNTCKTQRKWVISDYPLLNCITARECEMTCIINDLHHQKAYKKPHIRLLINSFLILQIVFELLLF